MENIICTLEEYKMLKVNLHIDLVNCYKKYQNKVGIVSIIGLFEIVKQELIQIQKDQ
jgi:hypothetical protein